MKKIVIALLAILAFVSAGAVAVQSDGGPYFGAEQEFFGPFDLYAGYEWRGDEATFAFEGRLGDLFDVEGVQSGPDISFGAYYDVNWPNAGLDIDFDVSLNRLGCWPDVYVDEISLWGRLDINLLPSPCGELDPCSNPEVVFFVEGGVDLLPFESGLKPYPGGSVGFEVIF